MSLYIQGFTCIRDVYNNETTTRNNMVRCVEITRSLQYIGQSFVY